MNLPYSTGLIAAIVANAMPDDWCGSITPKSPLRAMPLDSLGWEAVAMDIEAAFKIDMTAADMDSAETLADLAALVDRKRAAVAGTKTGET